MSRFIEALKILKRDDCLNVLTFYILIIFTVAAAFVAWLITFLGWLNRGVSLERFRGA